jgi:arabinogalactan oligomer/maltooligosaccharide transport system permease protein
MKYERAEQIKTIVSYLIIFLAVIAVLYPTLWIVNAAINPNNSLSSSTLIPTGATLDNFKQLFADYPFLSWYFNTIKIGLLNSALAVTLTALIGYVFSKYRFVGRKYGLMTLLVVQMFPVMMAMVAIYVLLNIFGLLDTHTGLLIVYLGQAVPFTSWMLKGYFDSIPTSLMDAARIDGAGRLRVFWQIMLPLAKPMLAVAAMMSFVRSVNDFVLARIVLTSEGNQTLAVGLYTMISQQFSNDWTLFAAGAILTAIPILIFMLSMQKYYISGLSSGATKG